MTIKITNIKNPDRFFEMVDQCQGQVDLVTDMGDCLNLKSALCRYVTFQHYFKDENTAEVSINIHDPLDYENVFKYNINEVF